MIIEVLSVWEATLLLKGNDKIKDGFKSSSLYSVFRRAMGCQSLTVLELDILGVSVIRAKDWMEVSCLWRKELLKFW